jgi:transposase-like protein
MPAGRPSDYTPELVEEFCRRVATGRSVLSVCADLDMPADTTIYRWRQEKPEFRDKLADARDDRLEAYADQMHALAGRVIEEAELDPQRVNAAVNAIDKAARLQAPKQRVELTGKNGGPVETEDRGGYDLARRIAFALSGVKSPSE